MRRLEVLVARGAIGGGAAFTVLVLVWHFWFDDAPWAFPGLSCR